MTTIDEAQKYLDDVFSNVRTRTTAWEAKARQTGAPINERQLKLIKVADEKKGDLQLEWRKEKIEENADSWVELLFGSPGAPGVLRTAAKTDDNVLYFLVLLSDALTSPTFQKAVLKAPTPYADLLNLLDATKHDGLQGIIASRTLGLIISYALPSLPSLEEGDEEDPKTKEIMGALTGLYLYLAKLSKHPETGIRDIAIQGYIPLLRVKKSRKKFWDLKDDTVVPLIEFLWQAATPTAPKSSAPQPAEAMRSAVDNHSSINKDQLALQPLYHALLVLWALTFESTVARELPGYTTELRPAGLKPGKSLDFIRILVLLMKFAIKEKIARLSIGILANLVRLAPDNTLHRLYLPGLSPLQILEDLQPRYTADADMVEDLGFLVSSLNTFLISQTKLDKYATEVISSTLNWSAPHRSTTFWKENAQKIFDYKAGLLIDKLVEALRGGLDERTGEPVNFPTDEQYIPIQVACHDLGALLNECPEKRHMLDGKGVKTLCLALMASGNPELRFEALQVVQLFLKNAFGSRY